MWRPAWVEDMRVVVVGDGRTEKEAYCIESEEELSEHVDRYPSDLSPSFNLEVCRGDNQWMNE